MLNYEVFGVIMMPVTAVKKVSSVPGVMKNNELQIVN